MYHPPDAQAFTFVRHRRPFGVSACLLAFSLVQKTESCGAYRLPPHGMGNTDQRRCGAYALPPHVDAPGWNGQSWPRPLAWGPGGGGGLWNAALPQPQPDPSCPSPSQVLPLLSRICAAPISAMARGAEPGAEPVHNREAPVCRICLDSEPPNPDEPEIISPCDCVGSSQWVHTKCLMRWQREVSTLCPPFHLHSDVRCSTAYPMQSWMMFQPRGGSLRGNVPGHHFLGWGWGWRGGLGVGGRNLVGL